MGQNNLVEKGYQVRNMDKVYRNAYYVSIWLGNEGEESNLAMDILEKFEEAWHTFKTTDYEAFRQGYIQFRKDNEHLTQHWMALEKLMKDHGFSGDGSSRKQSLLDGKTSVVAEER